MATIRPNASIDGVLSHPRRVQALAMMYRTQGGVSCSQISEQLMEPMQNIRYHLRVLGLFGGLDFVRFEHVRGSRENFYTLSEKILEDRKAMKVIERQEVPVVVPRRRGRLRFDTFERCKHVLDEREQDLIIRRYGWNLHRKVSREKLAALWHLEKSEIRSIERAALMKIEHARLDQGI